MFVARLVCSDPVCADAIAANAESLAELETLACECGCAFAVVGWPDWEEPVGPRFGPSAPGRSTAGASIVVLRLSAELPRAA